MSSTPNLLVSHIASSQNTKEVTANTAFDSFDEAICGNLAQAITDADFTFPTGAGSAPLTNMFISITGTLTANRNVIVPANKKPYVFSNQTTGGFAITIKTPSGSGVKLSNFDWVWLFCDGTNVVAIGTKSSLQSSNVDLTGQHTAISATTLLATGTQPGKRQYRISYVAKVTTPSDVASVLGGSNGFQVKYTHGDDSVVVTTKAGDTDAGNTTQSRVAGDIVIWAKASTNIQYQFDYSDSGIYTNMNFDLHVRIEAL